MTPYDTSVTSLPVTTMSWVFWASMPQAPSVIVNPSTITKAVVMSNSPIVTTPRSVPSPSTTALPSPGPRKAIGEPAVPDVVTWNGAYLPAATSNVSPGAAASAAA